MSVRRTVPVLAALAALTAGALAGSGQAATSTTYKFVGGPPVVYTSNNQVMVIWRFNKAAPRGNNGSLKTAVNVAGVGYTGDPSSDPDIGYGAATENKSKYCYQQIIQKTGALKNASVGKQYTVTAYVWSNTVKAKATLQKGNTTSGSTTQSMAKTLGC